MEKQIMYSLTLNGTPLFVSAGKETILERRKIVVRERIEFIKGTNKYKLLSAKINQITYFDGDEYIIDNYRITEVEVI